ncbi:MAG: hemerythrin domain-containing protein [Acidimicrobiia bacterium]
MDVEIRVDRARCIGSGQCVFLAPGVFDQDHDAKAVVTDPLGEPEERIVHAVIACPMQAITLRVGGTAVGAADLKDWAHGARSDDAVVSLLEGLCDDHHELREAFTGAHREEDPERAEEIRSLTARHLRNEADAYAAISALVDPRLVASFEDDHERIDRALRATTASEGDPSRQAEVFAELARAVSDHIRLEETVLFPVALAACRSRHGRPPRVDTPDAIFSL